MCSKGKKNTLTAACTASQTRPGLDCQVPNPTEGILAPVFSSKKRISSDILSLSGGDREV